MGKTAMEVRIAQVGRAKNYGDQMSAFLRGFTSRHDVDDDTKRFLRGLIEGWGHTSHGINVLSDRALRLANINKQLNKQLKEHKDL